jgi:hypothetical protein
MAGEWGEAAVKALRDWSMSVSGMSRSLPAVPGLVGAWSYLCEAIHYTAHSSTNRAHAALFCIALTADATPTQDRAGYNLQWAADEKHVKV